MKRNYYAYNSIPSIAYMKSVVMFGVGALGRVIKSQNGNLVSSYYIRLRNELRDLMSVYKRRGKGHIGVVRLAHMLNGGTVMAMTDNGIDSIEDLIMLETLLQHLIDTILEGSLVLMTQKPEFNKDKYLADIRKDKATTKRTKRVAKVA